MNTRKTAGAAETAQKTEEVEAVRNELLEIRRRLLTICASPNWLAGMNETAPRPLSDPLPKEQREILMAMAETICLMIHEEPFEGGQSRGMEVMLNAVAKVWKGTHPETEKYFKHLPRLFAGNNANWLYRKA